MSEVLRTRTDPRISRRRKALARSRRRRVLIRVAVVASLALGFWAAFFSPLLSVGEVRVIGGKHTSPAAVARVAGLDSSDNLLLVSTSEIARRVRLLPWVESAVVDRKLPGTVRVRIVERKPVLVVALGAAQWTIDATGRVLAAGAVEGDLPVLAGAGLVEVVPGERLASPEARAGLAAYESLSHGLREQVEAVFVPTVERITFSLTDGLQVRYGAAEHRRAKNAVLKVLLARLRAEGLTPAYVDVRVPESPALSEGSLPAETAGAAGTGATPSPSPSPISPSP